ncbi:MAG: hypothetical protein NVS1B4_01020 [Gemmatimonadaceae bacterium]
MPIFVIIFQVMQREPSLGILWAVYLVLGLAGCFAARYRPRYLWLIIPIIFLEGLAQRAELFDRNVKPLILLEAGRAYFTQSYLAWGIALLLTFAGVVWRRRSATRSADGDPSPPPSSSTDS